MRFPRRNRETNIVHTFRRMVCQVYQPIREKETEPKRVSEKYNQGGKRGVLEGVCSAESLMIFWEMRKGRSWLCEDVPNGKASEEQTKGHEKTRVCSRVNPDSRQHRRGEQHSESHMYQADQRECDEEHGIVPWTV